MSSESGIDLDFDVYEELQHQHNYYEVKTKSLLRSRTDPSVLMDPDMVTVKPDPDASSTFSFFQDNGLGGAQQSLMRTNFKQQLQREHLLQIEKKEMRKGYQPQQHSHPQRLNLPPSVPATSAPQHDSQTVIPIIGLRASLPANVPSSVLKVETKLQNPTQYYIRQQQRRQVQEYLSNQGINSSSNAAMPTSVQNAYGFASESTSPSFLNPSSNLMSPNSPDTTSSVASGSEADIVFDDLFGLEASSEQDFNMFSENVFAATLPTNNNLLDTYAHSSKLRNESTDIVSASCPAEVKKESPDTFMKERQKKDNHNMIERRRRYNINDRIKELGSLVPKLDNDFKQNKGTILKSSVDYIRRLQRDRERMKKYESRNVNLEEMNKKLMLRIQEMELILRAANISTTLPEPDLSSASSPQLTHLLMGNQTQAPSQTQTTMHTMQPIKSSSVPGTTTLHHLLKTQHGHNNNETSGLSNSVDSPRHMDLVVSNIDEDDCILMEGDGD